MPQRNKPEEHDREEEFEPVGLRKLLTETELFDELTVFLNVLAADVFQQALAPTDELQKATS